MIRSRRIPLYTLFALTWALMAVALLSGCVTQSIEPIYDDRTAVLDDRLLGSWGDDEAQWNFSADGSGGYRLLHTDEDVVIEASAHLARLDGRLFLDIYVDELPEAAGELYEALFLPLHTVFRVEEMDDTLRTSSLDGRWLKEYLSRHPDTIQHIEAEGRVVFTADTRALQAFVTQHADEADAWEEAIVMQRRPTNGR